MQNRLQKRCQNKFEKIENRQEEPRPMRNQKAKRRRALYRSAGTLNLFDIVPTFSLSPNIIIKVNSWAKLFEQIPLCRVIEGRMRHGGWDRRFKMTEMEKRKVARLERGRFSLLPLCSIRPTRFAIALLKVPAAASRSTMRPCPSRSKFINSISSLYLLARNTRRRTKMIKGISLLCKKSLCEGIPIFTELETFSLSLPPSLFLFLSRSLSLQFENFVPGTLRILRTKRGWGFSYFFATFNTSCWKCETCQSRDSSLSLSLSLLALLQSIPFSRWNETSITKFHLGSNRSIDNTNLSLFSTRWVLTNSDCKWEYYGLDPRKDR